MNKYRERSKQALARGDTRASVQTHWMFKEVHQDMSVGTILCPERGAPTAGLPAFLCLSCVSCCSEAWESIRTHAWLSIKGLDSTLNSPVTLGKSWPILGLSLPIKRSMGST